MKRWLGAMLLCTLAVRCATGEDDSNRKKPGGFDDAGKDSGGSGGTAGSSGSGGNGGAIDASGDGPDATLDAGSDAADAAGGMAGAGPDGAADADAAGPSGRLLMVARSDTQITFGETTGAGWTITNLTRSTLSAPAIAAAPWGALAVVRDQSGGALASASWDPTTGSWSAFSEVAAGGTTGATPALAAASSNVHLAFLGTDYKLYSAVHGAGSGWQGLIPVQGGAVQSFGPSAPALAASSTAVTLAQQGQDGDLYTQLWQAGWQSSHGHGLTVSIENLTPPAVVFRHGTGKAIVSYLELGTGRLMWTEGWANTWTSPIAVHAQALSSSSPALAALPNGDVVLAYRSTSNTVFASVLSGASFGAPVLVHPSLGTTETPAVAPGVGGHLAELSWVSGGSVQHSSLGTSGWSGPVAVAASGHKTVALASWTP
jgi:hypothetical protein